ncbi:hypothetical protein BT93_L5542 [Corymbia citriodora subsp. variegata]|uniref:Response regulatory domain-containing protein n=1 Tax=Corymbia citriodora subsp. variegata TaxID=360336 RepID=A0A8T0CW71_CORYI|nr:hypothetical protein BT93_L5542 [Corymbia citriodora subsp. variegata]
MARNGLISRRRRSSDQLDGSDPSPCGSEEVHVLAVDDSLVDRKVIERLLKISSCKVTAVDSGLRALRFLGLDEEKTAGGFNELKVDLIITDYCMPEMTGYELLKKIKESSALREIPVVIMSSENVLARIDRCMEEGAEDFIVKPVKLSDVKRLRDFMTRDVGDITRSDEGDTTRKRKLQESFHAPSSSPFVSSASSSSSASTTPSPSPTPSVSSSKPIAASTDFDFMGFFSTRVKGDNGRHVDDSDRHLNCRKEEMVG